MKKPPSGTGGLDIPARLRQRDNAMSAQELAAVLSCTPSNVLKKAKKGRIPSFRLDGLIRFDPVHIADWLQANSVAA
jgi:hypothetical protein